MVSPNLSRVWQHVKLSDFSLWTRPRYSLVVDEDVKKPNKQTRTSKTNKLSGGIHTGLDSAQLNHASRFFLPVIISHNKLLPPWIMQCSSHVADRSNE